MNYKIIYEQLIFRAICRTESPDQLVGYTEKHHIKPKSMGGTNHKWNLVVLSAREHYIAHHLLYKIHKNGEMAQAWFCMSNGLGRGIRHKPTGQQYELAKTTAAKHKSEKYSGVKTKPHTEESKRVISEKRRTQVFSEESKQKMSLAKLGKKLSTDHTASLRGRKMPKVSEETKNKISEAQRGKEFSEEHKTKLSRAKTGSKLSEQTRLAMSQAHLARQARLREMKAQTNNPNMDS